MNNTELISIIIPLYNKQNNIAKAIESVIRQSVKNWEIIVVDDGSIDGGANIVKTYKEKFNIQYIYQKNQGVSSARNLGMKVAEGSWILFLDADDYLLDDSLAILYNCAIKYQTLVSDANYYTEYENVRKPFCRSAREGKLKNNFYSWYMRIARPRTGATLIHKSVIQNIVFDEQLHRNEDIDFFFRIMSIYEIAHTSRCVMVYSLDSLSLSHVNKDYNRDYIFNIKFAAIHFWKNMCFATLINEGYSLYKEYINILRKKYSYYLLYAKIDVLIQRCLCKKKYQ